MIKKYKDYIKEQLDNHLDLDPYGEEDWDDNYHFQKNDKLLAKKSKFNRKGIEQIVHGNTYWISNSLRYANFIYYGISKIGTLKSLAVIRNDKMDEYFTLLPQNIRLNF